VCCRALALGEFEDEGDEEEDEEMEVGTEVRTKHFTRLR
jgi:hypothetical protein